METRIRRNIIILVVVTFLVLVGMSAGWFFVLVRPQREEIARVDQEYQTLTSKANQLKTALANERKAKDRLEYLQGQLALFRGNQTVERAPGLYRRLYFGNIEGTAAINVAARQEAWRKWMNEYHYSFGPALNAEFAKAERLAGVSLSISESSEAAAEETPQGSTRASRAAAIKVDNPPQKPEDVAIPPNGFLKPLSATNNGQLTLTVTGSFENIVRFLEYINRASILMVVGTIKLEDYSPNLKATFPVTPYLVAAGPGVKLSAGAAQEGGEGDPPDGPPGMGVPPVPDDTEAQGATVKIKNPRMGT